MIKIAPVGGYNEVGKNMTAVSVDDEVIILDMGLFLPAIIDFQEETEKPSAKKLIEIGAIPDDELIADWKDKVKAIVITHAHLDHAGAVPYLAPKYNVPIIGTPYTIEVIKAIVDDKEHKLPNKLIKADKDKIKLTEKLTLEFIDITHSTPQTAIIAIHTPYGIVMYANDFKLDNHPVLGNKPNYAKLGSLKNIKALIVDSLYSGDERKTPSEKVVREMLKDVMLGTDSRNHAVFITTFSSHLARLKSIIDFGKSLNRKILFLGRSLEKYVLAGEKAKIINFTKDVELLRFKNQIKKRLKKIEKDRGKYLIVCTGNQGEPQSVLSKIIDGIYPFKFEYEDHVIFSCRTIPTDQNIQNRNVMENKLKQKGVRIFTEIHASGHAGREDLRDFINLIKPEHIIPTHGDIDKLKPMSDLAEEMGYERDKTVHILRDGQRLELD